MVPRSLRGLVVLPLGVAALGGCSGDGVSPESGDIGQMTAEEQAAFALEFLDGLISGAPDLAAGNLGGAFARAMRPPRGEGLLRRDCFDGVCDDVEPVWDDAAGAWTAYCEAEETGCHLSFDFHVRFLDGAGTGQQQPGATTDRIVSQTDIRAGFTRAGAGSAGEESFEMDYRDAMEISGLQGSAPVVRGNGSMDGSAGPRPFSMTWTYDLTFPAEGGCPSGSVDVALGPYTIRATYTGFPEYELVMAKDGNEFRRETGSSRCDHTAANEVAIEEAGFTFLALDGLLVLTANLIPRAPSEPVRLDLAFAGRSRSGDCLSACQTIVLEWSAAEEAWVGRCTESGLGCDVFLEFIVRYLTADDVPQRDPDALTAHVDVDMRAILRTLLSLGDPGDIGELRQDFSNRIDVDTTRKPHAVTGHGKNDITLRNGTTDELLHEIHSQWTLDLGLPFDRDCMTGRIDLGVGPYRAISTYNGTNRRTWEVFRGTERIHAETTSSFCVQ